ncbi:MAG TPA: metallophosphoesterase family protein [Anaerolineaceae bacterium]|nr:metallophosphoesterase family protein [Anaerolineaceae bacterium]HPN50357.1 metallophosphoesterase family protein [Anaerolineaceae bacterium]
MIKIVVITDIHANLPALEAALHAIRKEGCDLLIQTGDVIGIGPYPAECLDLLNSLPGVEHIKGNHDSYFADGISGRHAEKMGEDEKRHHQWVHARLTPGHRAWMAAWPYLIEHDFEGVKTAFMHSGLGASREEIQNIPANAGPAELDPLFAPTPADVIFYGHRHPSSDVQGKARYINPGSLGCHPHSLTRYVAVRFARGAYEVEAHTLPYDDAPLAKAFEDRQVADRQFIYRAFFGGRFSS